MPCAPVVFSRKGFHVKSCVSLLFFVLDCLFELVSCLTFIFLHLVRVLVYARKVFDKITPWANSNNWYQSTLGFGIGVIEA